MKTEELIEQLKSSDGMTRNRAALELMDAGDQSACQPLVAAICDPANEDNRGTLVYALGAFDCSTYIDLMVDLVIGGNYEVASCAFNIIEDTVLPIEKKILVVEKLSKIDVAKLRYEHSSEAIAALQELLESNDA
jgi:HEAT repeat protein